MLYGFHSAITDKCEKDGEIMLNKVRYIALFIAVLFVPCFAFADEAYELFPFAGNIEFMSYSNEGVFIQATVEYPQSAEYYYQPQTMSMPEMLLDTLVSETDIVYVVNDKLFIHSPEAGGIKCIENGDVYTFPQNGWSPFLVSVYDEDALVFLMAKGEEIYVCRLDTLTGEFQSVNMGVSLFAIQPYGKKQSLLVNTDSGTGEKIISELNWETLEQQEKGKLSADATSIAYSKQADCIYYMADGCLWNYQWDGTKPQIAGGFPLWTDQRAFILDSGVFVTLDYNLDEALLAINLNDLTN